LKRDSPHCRSQRRRAWILSRNTDSVANGLAIGRCLWLNGGAARGGRCYIVGWLEWQNKMLYGVRFDMLGVLMSPREVMVIVVITAVIVYFAARKRKTKKSK